MDKNSRIYVADHEGFLGGVVLAALEKKGFKDVLLKTRKELDLKRQSQVEEFFKRAKPEYVFLSYQKSGGIMANIKHPAEFLYDNIIVEANVIHAAATNGVKKLLFFGASCMYPEAASQPIKEESFLGGVVEKTSEAYAVAKIAGVELCRAYEAQHGMKCVAVVPATHYGPGANFDAENSHVLGALIGKFHEALTEGKDEVVAWGSGKPLREFIYIEDLADACVTLMSGEASGIFNVGSGEEISIRELAALIGKITGYKGEIVFDATKPDGAKRKVLHSGKIKKLGWKPRMMLKEGIEKTYNLYKK
ncbi:MAG: GDP-L-fucose synthase [Candidatus Liptonbacteria bacterium]|nr:GDP-L-fucose synthase [Candidatus Liptonbacteria bacterium]